MRPGFKSLIYFHSIGLASDLETGSCTNDRPFTGWPQVCDMIGCQRIHPNVVNWQLWAEPSRSPLLIIILETTGRPSQQEVRKSVSEQTEELKSVNVELGPRVPPCGAWELPWIDNTVDVHTGWPSDGFEKLSLRLTFFIPSHTCSRGTLRPWSNASDSIPWDQHQQIEPISRGQSWVSLGPRSLGQPGCEWKVAGFSK